MTNIFPTESYTTESYTTESYTTESYTTESFPTERYTTNIFPTERYPTERYTINEDKKSMCSRIMTWWKKITTPGPPSMWNNDEYIRYMTRQD